MLRNLADGVDKRHAIERHTRTDHRTRGRVGFNAMRGGVGKLPRPLPIKQNGPLEGHVLNRDAVRISAIWPS